MNQIKYVPFVVCNSEGVYTEVAARMLVEGQINRSIIFDTILEVKDSQKPCTERLWINNWGQDVAILDLVSIQSTEVLLTPEASRWFESETDFLNRSFPKHLQQLIGNTSKQKRPWLLWRYWFQDLMAPRKYHEFIDDYSTLAIVQQFSFWSPSWFMSLITIRFYCFSKIRLCSIWSWSLCHHLSLSSMPDGSLNPWIHLNHVIRASYSGIV